jgi:hypothetical protein
MATEHVHFSFCWEHLNIFLFGNIEQMLGLYSVIASVRKILEKSFALGAPWDQEDHNETHWERW